MRIIILSAKQTKVSDPRQASITYRFPTARRENPGSLCLGKQRF